MTPLVCTLYITTTYLHYHFCAVALSFKAPEFWLVSVVGVLLRRTHPSHSLLREGLGRQRIEAHRNRSYFCDLRLRCPLRTPEVTSDRDKTKQGGDLSPTTSAWFPPGNGSRVANLVGLVPCATFHPCVYVYVR